VHDAAKPVGATCIQDERDIVPQRLVCRFLPRPGCVDRIDSIRVQEGEAVSLGEIGSRRDRNQMACACTCGDRPNLLKGQRRRTRHRHTARAQDAEKRAPPSPFAAGEDEYAVAGLETVNAQQVRPASRLASNVSEREVLDHTDRVDVRDCVMFALESRLEQVNLDICERGGPVAPPFAD
jgi:hypothetical protein